MASYSRTSIDRLGDRLRDGVLTEADLRLLDEYRRSFGEAYESVVTTIRSRLGLEPTGRPAKSTASIVEKLKRESMRLIQMQDIAGCRVVINDTVRQERAVTALQGAFEKVSIVDRRTKPSYGYRAVHAIIEFSGKPVEVQIRTALQHFWAELSEKLSDTVDPDIKYGGGPSVVRQFIDLISKGIANVEDAESHLSHIKSTLISLPPGQQRDELERALISAEAATDEARDALAHAIRTATPE